MVHFIGEKQNHFKLEKNFKMSTLLKQKLQWFQV